MIGTTIGHYNIVEKLGEGGMGVVYKATDTKLDRPVALKFLPPHVTADAEEKKRFLHEAKTASALDHPHICSVHEVDETDDGRMFIVMGYYQGDTLEQIIAKGDVPSDDVVRYVIQCAEGLQAAHSKGIIHRDIKSANLMVTPDGHLKIMDFGLAKSMAASMVTQAGVTVGTVPFMSPEQARGEKVDQRTDIWSLGVVMYQLLSGRLPFQGSYAEALVYLILNEEPPPLSTLRADVPQPLVDVVSKCLQKDPQQRYQDMGELLDDLKALNGEGLQGHRQVSAPAGSRKNFPKVLYPALAAVVIVLVAIAWYLWMSGGPGGIRSIAVLPMEDLSGQPDQDYFADGMTDALIGQLSKVGALKVISRTSAMKFKGVHVSLPDIAKELGVDALLEGSVTQAGDRVRIRATLFDATEQQLWSEEYERSMRDILKLQAEIARVVTQEVSVVLTPEEREVLTIERQIDPAAHLLYLKALKATNRQSHQAFHAAAEYLTSALAIDSTFVEAHILMAQTYLTESGYGYAPMKEAGSRAIGHITRALELDPNNGEAYAVRVFYREYVEWNWVGAGEDVRRALELNPHSATVLNYCAQYFSNVGDNDKALALNRRAIELDPLSPNPAGQLVRGLYDARRFNEAIEQGKAYLEVFPDNLFLEFFLGRAYAEIGEYEKAVEMFLGRSVGTASMNWALGYTYARMGKVEEARKILDFHLEKAKQQFIWPEIIAVQHMALGEKEQALEWLEKAAEGHELFISRAAFEPMFDPLRDEPRFRAIIERVNVPKGS